MKPYRIIVVDDSAFMRKLFSDIIESDPAFTVIAVGKNGREAVELHRELKPDAITIDLEMPEMNGIEALKRIMAEGNTPVIMLSGISEENTRETIAALALGAFDFIRKPSGPGADIRKTAEALMLRLRTAVSIRRPADPPEAKAKPSAPAAKARPSAKIKGEARAAPVPKPAPVPKIPEPPPKKRESAAPAPAPASKPPRTPDTGIRPEAVRPAPPAPAKPAAAEAASGFRHIIAVGTSTGGPRALHRLLSELPGDLPAPVLIVQHMPPKFTYSLAQRLNSLSALTVKEAEDGEAVRPGFAYIAPGGRHMRLAASGSRYVIRLTDEPQRNGHRPSVDILFESLVPFGELVRHAVIMTGMGSDGAKGMRALSDAGAVTTIAEAEETCIVFGMPRSAIEEGAVSLVLPLHDIPARLTEAVRRQS
jgi:Chemotaxis response regulator containing a CheY-like receiver domain and a methylesterase domain